jgi:hypothetical protein
MSASHIDEGLLHAWLDSALDADSGIEGAAIARHLAECAECRARLEEARASKLAVSAMLAASDAPVAPPPDFHSIEAAARAEIDMADPSDGASSKRSSGWRRGPHVRLAWAATVAVAVSAGLLARELSDRRGVDLPPTLEYQREAMQAEPLAERVREKSAQELPASAEKRQAPTGVPETGGDEGREGDAAPVEEDRATTLTREAPAEARADRAETTRLERLEAAGSPLLMSENRAVVGCWRASSEVGAGLPRWLRLRESADPAAGDTSRTAEAEREPGTDRWPIGSWGPVGTDSIVVSFPGFGIRLRVEADVLTGHTRSTAKTDAENVAVPSGELTFEKVPCPGP